MALWGPRLQTPLWNTLWRACPCSSQDGACSARAGHTLIYVGMVLRGGMVDGNGAGSRNIYYLTQVISLHKEPSVRETAHLARNPSKVQFFSKPLL